MLSVSRGSDYYDRQKAISELRKFGNFGTKNVLVGEMRILVAKKEVMGSNFGRTFLNPLGMLLSELNYLNVVLNVQVQEVKGT